MDRQNSNGCDSFNVSFSLEQDNHSGYTKLIINGEEKQIGEQRLLGTEYIHALILSTLYSQVKSHYLHHAAALSCEGKGVIITADSGYGKTTLTLALVQRGFRFLSDEIAALGRSDGNIYPFPRGLHIWEETLNMLSLPPSVKNASRWFDRYLVDIEDIFPGMISSPAHVSYIFVLKNGNTQNPNTSGSNGFRTVISHTNPIFIQHIHDHPGINEIQIVEEEGYPCLNIQTNCRMKVIPFVEDLCNQHGIIILDLIKREDEIPDFSPTVKCERISRSQAAIELLRRFLGGQKAALLNSATSSGSTQFLFELTSLIENADCYQLTIGPLKDMVDVISDLVCSER